MITVRMTAEVTDDRRVVLMLPPEVPTGPADLVVTVESANRTGAPPRGVPAAAVRGIGAGLAEPPDDATVEQWLDDRRLDRSQTSSPTCNSELSRLARVQRRAVRR